MRQISVRRPCRQDSLLLRSILAVLMMRDSGPVKGFSDKSISTTPCHTHAHDFRESHKPWIRWVVERRRHGASSLARRWTDRAPHWYARMGDDETDRLLLRLAWWKKPGHRRRRRIGPLFGSPEHNRRYRRVRFMARQQDSSLGTWMACDRPRLSLIKVTLRRFYHERRTSLSRPLAS